eukprot:4530248-Lingulodinium_polyedra.AAC.1
MMRWRGCVLKEVQRRGRWACDASVRRYQKSGRPFLQAPRLPPVLRAAACQAERQLAGALRLAAA